MEHWTSRRRGPGASVVVATYDAERIDELARRREPGYGFALASTPALLPRALLRFRFEALAIDTALSPRERRIVERCWQQRGDGPHASGRHERMLPTEHVLSAMLMTDIEPPRGR